MRRYTPVALILILAATIGIAFAQPATDPPKPFTGKVVAIADGDTITVLVDKAQHKIRLEGIDAPESGQDFGTKAKQILGDKIFGKDVKVEWKERDKYKRILGHVYIDGRHINHEMVSEGYAWWYSQYSKDQALAKAEKEAREAKLGLWTGKMPVAPWDFRRGKGIEDPNAGKVDPATFVVYLTASGKKYHSAAGCKFLAKSKTEAKLADVAGKYEPCTVCKPPVLGR